ncbi:hypothetical protein KKC97_12420 [bacterium]|nr:hypothetical protein [bacterium]
MNKTSISSSNTRHASLILSVVICLFASAVQALPGSLLDVRVGTHRQHDRLVMELDRDVKYAVYSENPDKITVRLYDAIASHAFALPVLQKDLAFIQGIEAYLIGANDLEIDIALAKQSTEYKILELEGNPWRLVVDISEKSVIPPVDASKPVQNEEPEYVPGDKPIETRFAEAQTAAEKTRIEESVAAADSTLSTEEIDPELANTVDFADSLPLIPEPPLTELAQIESGTPVSDETVRGFSDSRRANSILHHYYLAIGDTESALAFGEIGSFDDMNEEDAAANTSLAVTLAALVYQMPWLILAAALLTGTFGGLFAYWITGRFFSNSTPRRKPKVKKIKAVAIPQESVAKELEKDLDTLDSAVEQEPKTEETEAPVPEPEPVTEAEAGGEAAVPADEEVKETAMERRVKRVLELSKSGTDIESIAKQLEMSQDEVKLILDLN